MNIMKVWNWGLIGILLLIMAIGVTNAKAEVIEVDSEIFASLSGFVYCDINNSGTYDTGEDMIRDVLIILDGLIDPIDPELPEAQAWGIGQRPLDPGEQETLQRFTWTDSTGHYSFDNVLPGTYSIMEVTPYMFVEGRANAPGNLGGDAVTSNHFANVVIPALAEGTNYNFGEWGLRTKYLSKRSLIVVVPEPSTISVIAGAILLGIFWTRRR